YCTTVFTYTLPSPSDIYTLSLHDALPISHLAGICPVVTASNYHENWTYQGGAFVQWFDEDWTSGLSQNAYEHLVGGQNDPVGGIDRKSTRLNSSHVKISYAVFCLKKKKKK